MKNGSQTGGVAALMLAAAYLIGIVMNFSLLDMSGITDPAAQVAFLGDHYALMYIWILLIYVIFGIFLVFLGLALYDRLKEKSPVLAQAATAFALIWSALVIASGMVHNVGMGMALKMAATDPQAAGAFWSTINAMHIGLGGGNEIPGGLWSLLISLAALRAGAFPKWINILGIVAGAAGLLTVVPALFDAVVGIFALGQIVWWIGLGVVLMRPSRKSA